MTTKNDLLATKSLEEAIYLLFGNKIMGKTNILAYESMQGDVAKEYHQLGNSARQETYMKIAEDFKVRTGCYGVNRAKDSFNVGTIVDVACGSGLLTLQLANQTNSDCIVGVDSSEDMLNIAKENLQQKSNEETERILSFWNTLTQKPSQNNYKELKQNPPLLNKVHFQNESAYHLESINLENVNYVICRNALHRFKKPKDAIKSMCSILEPSGKLYLRDLRRDANWDVVLERIGEKRWDSDTLVNDYIGAMASMFTTSELEETLFSLGIKKFSISDGSYVCGEIQNNTNIKEFSQEVEYVCVIEK